jgi:hypothetical protein
MTKSHGWNEVFNMWDKKKMWEKATNISETSSFLASENVWDLIWTRVQSGDKKHHEREDIKSVMVLTYYCRYTTKLLLFSLTTHFPTKMLLVFGGGWTHLGAAHSHFGPQLCMSKQRPKVWLGIIHGAKGKQGRQ